MNQGPERTAPPGASSLAPDDPYREVFEASPAAMWVHDEETLGFVAVNDAALQLYGYSREEFLGQSLQCLCPAGEPGLLAGEIGWTGSGAGPIRHLRKDGTSLEVELSARPVVFEGRRCQLVLAQDATRFLQERTVELEAANEALVESQFRFRQMAENIRDVFWLTNPWRSSIIYVNPAFEKVWGSSCQALYTNPQSWLEGVHPEDRPRLRRFFMKRQADLGYEHSYRVVRPDGSVRWVLDRGFPVQDNSGRFYRLVAIARDITERKELEKEVLAISEREQRRIGQDLHDDLCQQLVGIEFLSKALQQQLKKPAQSAMAGEIAQLIRAATDHSRQLARGLIPLEPEAEGLMRGLQALAARTSDLFRVQCSFQCPAPVLVGDPTVGTDVYRIAQEAVTNSIRHGRAKHIEIELAATGEGGVLMVTDDGLGLSAKADDSGGLGLRIMQYRADTMGGSVSIQPAAGGGTRILCTFPLSTSQMATPART